MVNTIKIMKNLNINCYFKTEDIFITDDFYKTIKNFIENNNKNNFDYYVNRLYDKLKETNDQYIYDKIYNQETFNIIGINCTSRNELRTYILNMTYNVLKNKMSIVKLFNDRETKIEITQLIVNN